MTRPSLQSAYGRYPARTDDGSVPLDVGDCPQRNPDSAGDIAANSRDGSRPRISDRHAGWPGNQRRPVISAAANAVYGLAGTPVPSNTVD